PEPIGVVDQAIFPVNVDSLPVVGQPGGLGELVVRELLPSRKNVCPHSKRRVCAVRKFSLNYLFCNQLRKALLKGIPSFNALTVEPNGYISCSRIIGVEKALVNHREVEPQRFLACT